jgi:hypothetical protein
MITLPKVVHELCADEAAAANHYDLHMFMIAGAERFDFHNGGMDWMIQPAAMDRERLAGAPRLPRSPPIADARAHLHRLR